ncbi:hypothetical protein LTR09_003043 [Extremus antarcticus]|uniref:Uncharacterized protein n=1 Tax=Extremus antarcticus TaxID=702011 RepID=A0AAJ0GE70_9PEZI|nr:hypothetical protein LTR09_003043 [Extremus antarcticus]
MVDTTATRTDEQANAAEHNATHCPLLCLPTELRLQIEEYVIADLPSPYNKSWPAIPADLGHNMGHGYLQTCHLLRTEMLPLFLSAPGLRINFRPELRGSMPLITRRLAALEDFLEITFEVRDIGKDSLDVGLNFDIIEEQDVDISFACVDWRMGRHTVSIADLPADLPPFGGAMTAVEMEVYHSVSAFVEGLNERRDSSGRPKSLENDHVRGLFVMLCGKE